MNADKMISLISACVDRDIGIGATTREIAAAMERLGVVMSGSYVQFLSHCGWGRFRYDNVAGIGDGIPVYYSLLKMTEKERTRSFPPLPIHLLPIMNDGAGNHYCLDTSVVNDGENPMVFWDHELQEQEWVADCFAQWLIGRLEK